MQKQDTHSAAFRIICMLQHTLCCSIHNVCTYHMYHNLKCNHTYVLLSTFSTFYFWGHLWMKAKTCLPRSRRYWYSLQWSLSWLWPQNHHEITQKSFDLKVCSQKYKNLLQNFCCKWSKLWSWGKGFWAIRRDSGCRRLKQRPNCLKVWTATVEAHRCVGSWGKSV